MRLLLLVSTVAAVSLAIPLAQLDVPSTPIATEVADVNNATEVADVNNGVAQGPPPSQVLGNLNATLDSEFKGNLPNDHYPIPPEAQYSIKESSETVASVPIKDDQNKSLHGVYSEPVTLDRPEELHPMEVASPLDGEYPCDPSHIVQVSVPRAQPVEGKPWGMLPPSFGCSGEYEIGREKASPEVSWTNVANDVVEFSLQLVSMGDGCSGRGANAGKILWHVVGINDTAPSIVFKEGASHDRRLLHGGTEEPNQWLEEYYSGPCPPVGITECYRFKVLAHRASGYCQCGHYDVMFHREDKVEHQPWVYSGTLHNDPPAPTTSN